MTPPIRPLIARDITDIVELSLLAWEPVFRAWEHLPGSKLYPIAIFPDWRKSQAEAVEKTISSERYATWVAEDVYRFVAGQREGMGLMEEALFAAIRSCESKVTEEYGRAIAASATKETLARVVGLLLHGRPAAAEQATVTATLGVLADMIPPLDLDTVVERLSALLQWPEEFLQQREVRRRAAVALARLVPPCCLGPSPRHAT